MFGSFVTPQKPAPSQPQPFQFGAPVPSFGTVPTQNPLPQFGQQTTNTFANTQPSLFGQTPGSLISF
jgi:hypothetical protein